MKMKKRPDLKDDMQFVLRQLRRDKRFTLEELANSINKQYKVNFNKGMISKWENGQGASLTAVKILSLYYGITINELLGFPKDQQLRGKIIRDLKWR